MSVVTPMASVVLGEDSSFPKFRLGAESRFDQTTFSGRLQHFLNVISPAKLMLTEQDTSNAKKLLLAYRAGNVPAGTTTKDMWLAQEKWQAVMRGSLAPTEGGKEDFIPNYGRISSFIPANIPILFGMLNSPGLAGTLFWQWFNQTYNCGMNYHNRSGDIPFQWKSYGLAVGVSCGIAMASRAVNVAAFARIPWLVPYLAVASAGSCNVFFTRSQELEDGVPLQDEHGNEVGMSREAAKRGLALTIASRSCGLPLPILLGPHMIMNTLFKGVRSPRARMLLELGAITTCLCGFLPCVLAAFPQRLPIEVSSLESEFHSLHDREGRPITTLYSNKGL